MNRNISNTTLFTYWFFALFAALSCPKAASAEPSTNGWFFDATPREVGEGQIDYIIDSRLVRDGEGNLNVLTLEVSKNKDAPSMYLRKQDTSGNFIGTPKLVNVALPSGNMPCQELSLDADGKFLIHQVIPEDFISNRRAVLRSLSQTQDGSWTSTTLESFTQFGGLTYCDRLSTVFDTTNNRRLFTWYSFPNGEQAIKIGDAKAKAVTRKLNFTSLQSVWAINESTNLPILFSSVTIDTYGKELVGRIKSNFVSGLTSKPAAIPVGKGRSVGTTFRADSRFGPSYATGTSAKKLFLAEVSTAKVKKRNVRHLSIVDAETRRSQDVATVNDTTEQTFAIHNGANGKIWAVLYSQPMSKVSKGMFTVWVSDEAVTSFRKVASFKNPAALSGHRSTPIWVADGAIGPLDLILSREEKLYYRRVSEN